MWEYFTSTLAASGTIDRQIIILFIKTINKTDLPARIYRRGASLTVEKSGCRIEVTFREARMHEELIDSFYAAKNEEIAEKMAAYRKTDFPIWAYISQKERRLSRLS